MLSVAGICSNVAVLDTPVETETTAYEAAVTSAGGSINAAERNAVNLFVHAGKTVGWYTKILDCCFFIGADLTTALVKLVVAPARSATVINRSLVTPGTPWNGAGTGPFTNADYSRTGVLPGITTDINKVRELGTDVIPTNHSLNIGNFSAGLILEQESQTGSEVISGSQPIYFGDNQLDGVPNFYFQPFNVIGTDTTPSNQWARSDSVAVSYTSLITRGAIDGQLTQNYTAATDRATTFPAVTLDTELTLFQYTGSGGFKNQSDGTLGGYFIGSTMSTDELESITLEMKLLHHRAHSIAAQPLWVGIGDSITYGATTGAPWKVAWFSKTALSQGARLHTSALFGGMATALPATEDPPGLPMNERYLKLKALSPAVVTLMGGTNDMQIGGSFGAAERDGTVNGDPAAIANYKAAIKGIAVECKSWGSRVFILSPPYTETESQTKVAAYVAAAMAAATEAGVTGIDVYTAMVNGSATPLITYISDDPHPNQTGHNFINALLLAAL